MRCGIVAVALLLTAIFVSSGGAAASGGATVTTYDASGTVLLNGTKVFPIVLGKGPLRDGTTPSGADALNEVIGAGVNFFKVGPASGTWTSADTNDAELWDQAVAARGAYTWINLSTLSQAQPGSSTDTLLHQVVTTLKSDPSGSPAIGMWKGTDEPWWSGIPVSSLEFPYCLATSRGDPAWCAGEAPIDSDHLWVTIEAPKGTASDLAPYGAVTDAHGEDEYPITINGSNPDLHQVGVWTRTIASISSAPYPTRSVWSTLQICSSGSYDADGNYVLPTKTQERYMIYDAIINGARNLNFYGGNNPNCFNSTDATYGWNWTFWNNVLKSLIQEINASSPLAPALVNPGSNQVLATSDSTTEAISRLGSSSSDLWVIAARSGSGKQTVTISGLPSTITSGTVYTEGRSVSVSNGSFTDSFDQWGVHVYHLSAAATNPDFSLSATPASETVAAGGSTSYATTVTPSGGFSSSVTLSVSGLPTGASGSFSPNPTSSTSTLTVTTSATTPAGTYPLTISGTSGSLTHTTQVTLLISATTNPDFSISASPASQTVVPSGAVSYSITVTPSGGFSGAVTVSVSGLPKGATATFSQTSTYAWTLTVNTTTSTKMGNATLTITGTSGTLSHSTTVTLLVKRK